MSTFHILSRTPVTLRRFSLDINSAKLHTSKSDFSSEFWADLDHAVQRFTDLQYFEVFYTREQWHFWLEEEIEAHLPLAIKRGVLLFNSY